MNLEFTDLDPNSTLSDVYTELGDTTSIDIGLPIGAGSSFKYVSSKKFDHSSECPDEDKEASLILGTPTYPFYMAGEYSLNKSGSYLNLRTGIGGGAMFFHGGYRKDYY